MKLFLQYILPLAFPAALYFAWKLFGKHRAEDGHEIDLTEGPWIKLFGAGVILMTVGLLVFNQMDGEKPGGKYHSPVFKDGKIIPGHVTRDD